MIPPANAHEQAISREIDYWIAQHSQHAPEHSYILKPEDRDNAFINNEELAKLRQMGFVITHIDIKNREVWIHRTKTNED